MDNVEEGTTITRAHKDSFYGRMKQSQEESISKADGVKSVFVYLCATVGWILILVIVLPLVVGLPIAMIVMGSLYVDDCPAERYIPIYLVVAGCFTIVRSIIRFIRKVCCTESESVVHPEVILDLFLFAWFIAGNVWIYRTRGTFSTDPTAADYCDPTLYGFSFWLMNSIYILLGVSLVFALIGGCIAAVVALASGS